MAKGHIPEKHMRFYRIYMNLARKFKELGDSIGQNDPEDSQICWRLAAKYANKAQLLRVDIPQKEN